MMLRSFFVLLCILLTAQATMSQRIRNGLSAGVVASQVDGDNLDGYHKPGVSFGGISNVTLGKKWSTQFEINYTQKGSRTAVDTTGTLPYYRLRLQYIEVPIVLIHSVPLKKSTVLIEGGLVYGTLLKAIEESNYYSPGLGEGVLKNDYSFLLGMGFGFGKKFFFNVRYEYSFMPMRVGTVTKQRSFFSQGQKNNLLCFSMRYYITSFL